MDNLEIYKTLLEGCRNNLRYSQWFNSLSMQDYTNRLKMELEEVLEALENNDVPNLVEELGDLYWMIHSLIIKAIDKYDFSFDDVISTVLDKFKRRKPHIFNKKELALDQEVSYWHKVKSEEKMVKKTG
ncbi:MAG: hypothetical protein JXB88_01800 [Spirochaetales bacterium]|nr:hypothetical protein [Spirochaetales bacterium]